MNDVPRTITIKRIMMQADFRCRDEGFVEHAIDRLAKHQNPGAKGSKGLKWARAWWAKHVDSTPGACVLFINASMTIMALVGRKVDADGRLVGFYSQARFGRRVDLGALKTAFREGWGLDVEISQTFEQKYEKAKLERRDEPGPAAGGGWWML
jgi:hypothetical protein